MKLLLRNEQEKAMTHDDSKVSFFLVRRHLTPRTWLSPRFICKKFEGAINHIAPI